MNQDNDKTKYYIMIGSKIITKELFRPILRPLDNYSTKPSGGFWACEYKDLFRISDWFSLLLSDPDIRKYKNIKYATLFSLKQTAKILNINTKEQVEYLQAKYPSQHHQMFSYKNINEIPIDYEKLSTLYDGLYVDIYKLSSYKATETFKNWDINSLVLFNLDCIDKYQSMNINDNNNLYYLSRIDGIKKEVLPLSNDYIKLYTQISKYIDNNLIKQYNQYTYSEFLDNITKTISKLCKKLCFKGDNNLYNILSYLREEGIEIDAKNLIINISLNYIATYFNKNKDNIYKLKPSNNKILKKYVID